MADSPSKPAISDFSAAMTGNRTFTLLGRPEMAGPGHVTVLYFYPKDNTPGCTTESMAFRDLHEQLRQAGAEVYGVSRDSIRSHEAFKAKLGLPFELIADPDEAVCTLFGVIKQKQMYGKPVRGIERSTFVIDAEGKLVKEWRGVKVTGHVDEVLDFVVQLSHLPQC